MSFLSIHGQVRAKQMLQNGLRKDTLSHAYIFSGPVGSGRREMALALVQAIYCTENVDDGCGGCLNCRKVIHRNHPDFYWIAPDGASLKIDQVRGLQKEFNYRSTASQPKIYVLEEADLMTTQAANSLLKFLEEPNSDVLAILITENGHALLPTIQSRAQWVPFTPRSVEEMTQLLVEEGLQQELIRPAVQLTAGIKAAKELMEENWFAEARNVVIQLSKETLANSPTALITAQQKVSKADWADHLHTFLDLWILWYKDLIHVHSGRQNKIVYIDQLDWITQNAFSRSVGFWILCMEYTLELQKRLRSNHNPQLGLEKLIIDVQRRC